eukprot:GHVL01018944.1.p1 GENE.GHVL01018944.1~~GHVL01018944.1.p1  ORF type:complete len:314 (-),score=73.50 GHVL01018944.1:1288-2229(-)
MNISITDNLQNFDFENLQKMPKAVAEWSILQTCLITPVAYQFPPIFIGDMLCNVSIPLVPEQKCLIIQRPDQSIMCIYCNNSSMPQTYTINSYIDDPPIASFHMFSIFIFHCLVFNLLRSYPFSLISLLVPCDKSQIHPILSSISLSDKPSNQYTQNDEYDMLIGESRVGSNIQISKPNHLKHIILPESHFSFSLYLWTGKYYEQGSIPTALLVCLVPLQNVDMSTQLSIYSPVDFTESLNAVTAAHNIVTGDTRGIGNKITKPSGPTYLGEQLANIIKESIKDNLNIICEMSSNKMRWPETARAGQPTNERL